jgi:hypothetical protein
VDRDIDQSPSNPAPPQLGLDEQPVQLGNIIVRQYCRKAGDAGFQFGDDDFAALDLPKRELDGVGFRLELFAIFTER